MKNIQDSIRVQTKKEIIFELIYCTLLRKMSDFEKHFDFTKL